MTLGNKIKALREEKNMTLEDVARSINVGRATIYKYENGMITNIPSDKVELLASLFSVSPSYLMGWNESEPPDKSSTVPENDDIRLLVRDLSKLSPEQVEQAKEMFRLMFKITNPELFKENDNDDT